MTLQVLLFATLRDRAGNRKSIAIDLPAGATVHDLKAGVAEAYPSLKASMATCLVAVDREYAFDPDPIPAGAEVALFPPVSGG